MIIKQASEKDLKKVLILASKLNKWFNKTGIKNMKTDFNMNHVAIACESKKILGFICYNSYSGRMQLIWMGVSEDYQKKGIGGKLLEWLEKESKRLNLHSIELETLPEEIKYKPYEYTRNFYYKNGFKRICYKKSIIPKFDDQIVLAKRI